MIGLLLAGLAFAADHRDHVDQARLFARREWYADAEAELERAVALPDGELDPEAWYLLAMVRRQLADHDGARDAADRARLHARTADEAAAAAALLDWLDRFGTLRIEGVRATRVALEAKGPLLDPELERWVRRVAERARRPDALPLELDLPAGSYTVNGSAVDLRAGEVRALALAPTATDRIQLDVRTSVSTLFGPAASHLLPSPSVGVGAWIAVGGPWVVGLEGDVGLQVWQAPTSSLYAAPAAWSGGARVGLDAVRADPFVLRPALGWRVAQVGGLPLTCGPDGGCHVGTGAAADAHAVGTAHLPYAELALRTRPRRGWGGGVRLAAELAVGAPPTPLDPDGPDVVQGSWRAAGLRLGVDLSYAP